jgi:preprotein translocase subunit SecF
MLISLPSPPSDAAHDQGRKQVVDALTRTTTTPVSCAAGRDRRPDRGKQLEKQAWLATLYSLIGMLIYLWFRFRADLWRGRGGGGLP